ncbi:MAG: hypothetical protein J5737_06365 [Bacteroidales bacterium]|nr:hypothetical protein [Bacteroidales bacterium]
MKKIVALLSICLLPFVLSAQEQKTPEQREKEFYEAVQQQIDRLTALLDLDDSQIFYADSILTHDYTAMQEEYVSLSQAKVSNADIYYDVQDKWMEQIYNSFHRILDEDQWQKYLKSGAARDKKARDKRAEKKLKK